MTNPSGNPDPGPAGGDQRSESAGPAELSDFDLALLGRMREVTDRFTYSEISRQTGIHRESCRRYLVHGKPTMDFLAVLCQRMEISAHWLLLGVGPRTRHEHAAAWLHSVQAPELVLELGRRWQANQQLVADLRERLVRLEARVRSQDPDAEEQAPPADSMPIIESKPSVQRAEAGATALPNPPPGLPPDAGLKYDAPYGGAS